MIEFGSNLGEVPVERKVMKAIFLFLLTLTLATPSVFALAGQLNEPGVALPEHHPEAARKRIMAALNRADCKFLGGNFLNAFTTLRYAGDTKALNRFLDDLANCPGVTLSVSFVKSLPEAGDWQVQHEARSKSKGLPVRF